MTQDQLAEKTGLSVDYISLIERGINAPSFEVIERLCSALNVKPEDFFKEDGR